MIRPPLLLALLSTAAVAQIPGRPLVPIHTAPADQVAYGLWGAGPAYKASFHAGFAYHPVVGPAQAGVAVRWRTVALGRGTPGALPAATPVARASGLRAEFDLGGAVEAYDLRADGVEQTFVFAGPPPGAGDLVVAGDLETELTPHLVPVGAGQAEVVLCTVQGDPIVRYGAAVAFDAAGRRVAVRTTLRGARVELVVPAAFVDAATFPLTIDPLLGTVALSSTGSTVETDVASAMDAGPLGVLIASVTAVNATDADVYVHLTNRDFTNPRLVFSDITASWSTPHARTGFVRGAGGNGRWVIALERDFPAQVYSRTRVVFHDYGNTTLNSGTVVGISAPAGSTHRDPDIASAYGGTRTLLTWQSDVTANQANTINTETEYAVVDAQARSIGPADIVANTPVGTLSDRERVRLTQIPDDVADPTWIAVWQQRVSLLGSWRAIGQRLSLVSGKGTATTLTRGVTGAPAIEIRPEVGGSDGRFAMFGLRVAANGDATGTHIVGTRFDWPTAAATPTVLAAEVVAVDPLPNLGPPDVECDVATNSHWVGVYMRGTRRVDVVRVGYDMGRTEALVVNSETVATMGGPAVALDNGGRFLMTWGMLTSGAGVRARALVYPAATSALYGTGCGGTIGAGHVPLWGHEQWPVTLGGAAASVPAVLLVGFAPATIPLAFLGMGACVLNVAPAPMVNLPASTSAGGTASLLLPLPAPGELFLQWAFLSPGANPLGLRATQGMQASVR